MKKEKNPILVIFCIIILLLFIILPPTFRSLIPNEEEKTPAAAPQPKLLIVSCNRIYQDELYQVSSRAKYIDGVISTNILTYQKLDALPENFTPSEISPTVPAQDDLNYFKGIPNIQVNEQNNITTITLDSSLLDTNTSDDKINNYIQDDYTLQKEFYENQGYKCNILES